MTKRFSVFVKGDHTEDEVSILKEPLMTLPFSKMLTDFRQYTTVIVIQ